MCGLHEALASSFVDRLAAYDGTNNLDILDPVARNRVQVFCQDNIIRQLAGSDRAFDVLLVRVIGSVEGVHADGFVERDLLVSAPGFAVPTSAGHHALDGHARIKGARTEIGASRDLYPGV